MYDATPDPYCYPGTRVLKNLVNLKRAADLKQFELALTTQRMDEAFPEGRLSVRHYYAVHHHIFQDVYRWAGKPRTVRITKGASTFCYPENTDAEMKKIFAWLKRERYLRGRDAQGFAEGAAHFLSELIAIHAKTSNHQSKTLLPTGRHPDMTVLQIHAGRRVRRLAWSDWGT